MSSSSAASNADDDDEPSLESLFVCEQYVERDWVFHDGTAQHLLCSNMSSTDHDLTGQIVWPASVCLGWFVSRHRDSIFRSKNVLELGAGCGLAGFLSTQFRSQIQLLFLMKNIMMKLIILVTQFEPNSSTTVITDGNEVVLRLLQKNKDYLIETQAPSLTESCIIRKLVWGSARSIIEAYAGVEELLPDVIIGADVILWPNYIKPLLATIRMLLTLKPNTTVCYISYVVRATSVTDRLRSTAETMGLSIVEIDTCTFLPEELPLYLRDIDKRLFKISLIDTETAAINLDNLVDSVIDETQDLEHSFSPY